MKQYLLFVCDDYEGMCGWRDFVADFKTLKQALSRKTKMCENTKNWWNIADTKTGLLYDHRRKWLSPKT